MRLEIGGGTLVQPGWVNLDPRHGTGEWKREAQQTPWPTGDNTVDAIRASHVLEHIPKGQPIIDVLNEAHRVLKPGCVFEVRVPNCETGWHAYGDLTHVSLWCIATFHYIDGTKGAHAEYGNLPWRTVEPPHIQGDNEILWKGTPR
jgi:SAM-dependent methyltransferase